MEETDRLQTPDGARMLVRLRYRMLGRFWWLVSPGAVLLLAGERAWLQAPTLGTALAAVRIEQWVAVVLLALHGWFLWRGRKVGGSLPE